MSETIMNEEDLYQKILLDNARNPTGFGALSSFDLRAEGINRLCGDVITIYLKVNDNQKIHAAAFSGESCAICKGAASMMMKQLPQMKINDVQSLIGGFESFIINWDENQFREFEALKVIKKFPTRLKCLKLPWETLKAALNGKQQSVTTE